MTKKENLNNIVYNWILQNMLHLMTKIYFSVKLILLADTSINKCFII
jgi:hypothetical protein